MRVDSGGSGQSGFRSQVPHLLRRQLLQTCWQLAALGSRRLIDSLTCPCHQSSDSLALVHLPLSSIEPPPRRIRRLERRACRLFSRRRAQPPSCSRYSRANYSSLLRRSVRVVTRGTASTPPLYRLNAVYGSRVRQDLHTNCAVSVLCFADDLAWILNR